MNESIFERLDHEWHGHGEHASSWFHRHHPDAPGDGTSRDDPVTASGVTMNATEPQATPPPGDTVSLKELAANIQADLEELLVRGHRLADEYAPQVAAIGEKVENDDLIQAVEAAVLPPEARTLIAELITKLAKTYPAPAVEAPAADVPGDAAPEAAAEAEHVAA